MQHFQEHLRWLPLYLASISSTESQTCSHLGTFDRTSLKYSSLHSRSLKLYQNVNSFKDIFQRFFWTFRSSRLQVLFYRCFTKQLFKERLRVAASMAFSEVSGWLLFKTSLLEAFSQELLTCLNKYPRFVYFALLNCAYMKEGITVNKK